jgi:hypothetical protein
MGAEEGRAVASGWSGRAGCAPTHRGAGTRAARIAGCAGSLTAPTAPNAAAASSSARRSGVNEAMLRGATGDRQFAASNYVWLVKQNP